MLNISLEEQGFDEFIDKLGSLSKGGLVSSGFQKYVNYTRNLVIQESPIGDPVTDLHRGSLKKSWGQPVYTSNTSEIKATVTNGVEYGMAENYGHRQTPGIYVPTINAVLRHNWVPGTYRLEAALDDAGVNIDMIIRPEVLRNWYNLATDPSDSNVMTVRQTYYDRPGDELNDTSAYYSNG